MMKTSVRRRLFQGLAIALVVGGSVLAGSTASAGPQHHGTNPATTGCNGNAALISTRQLEGTWGPVNAYVQVYYSYSCQTNWIRVTGNPAGGAAIKDLRVVGGGTLPSEVDYGTGSSYSMQVYAPGSTCIEYQVHLRYPNGAHYAEAYDPAHSWIRVC